MPTNRKATWAKRQREQGQKDRAAERLTRRSERKARAAERAASGQVGPQIADPEVPENDADLDGDADADDAAAPPLEPSPSPVAGLGPQVRSHPVDAAAPPARKREQP